MREELNLLSPPVPPLAGYRVVASALCLTRTNGCLVYVKESLDATAIGDFDFEVEGKKQGRLVGVRVVGGVSILGVYAINTLTPSDDRRPKEAERAAMDENLAAQVAIEYNAGRRLVVAGDLNVTLTMLDKGKAGGNLWGGSFSDIASPISRVEGLCESYELEDTYRVSHATLKVSRQTRTTTYVSNTSFGRHGARLDYVLASKASNATSSPTKEDCAAAPPPNPPAAAAAAAAVAGVDGADAEAPADGEVAASPPPEISLPSTEDAEPPPRRKKQRTEGVSWWKNSEVYYGKGWRLSNDTPGSGSDHLATIIELLLP